MTHGPSHIAGVVLAAGFSRRLGRPKQLVEIGGETLLGRTVRIAADAGLEPLKVVVRPDAAFDDIVFSAVCEMVKNEAAQEGIAASIRVGVGALKGKADLLGIVILTCDQILLSAKHVRLLCADPGRLTASAYAGKLAVPAYFPSSWFPQLMHLSGYTGARDLLREAYPVEAELLALDIDTEQDVLRAQAHFRSSGTPES